MITSRAQWLAERKTRLGASDTPAVAGLDPHRTALDVHLEKIGQKSTGESPVQRRGRLFEPAVLAYLQDELPEWSFTKPNHMLICDDHRISATPDLIATEPDEPGVINVQCKVISRFVFDLWEDEAPAGYQLQTAQESLLMDARAGLLAVLVVDSWTAELHLYTVPRHDAAEAKILDISGEFWRRIAAGELPPINYHRDAETVGKLFRPRPEVTPIDLTGDNRIIELLEQRDRVKHDIGLGEADIVAINAEIVAKLGGAEAGVLPGWKITNKMQHRKSYTVAEADFPVLRVSRTKERAP